VELLPDLSIGLWNAWIIMVIALATTFVPFMFGAKAAEQRMADEPDIGEYPTRSRVGVIVTHAVLMPFTLIYSIFVPLALGTPWLVVGLAVSGLAISMSLATSVTFITAPLDRPITTGIYAISRHPMYVSGILVYAGIGLAGTSWVFVACAVIEALGYAAIAPAEEDVMLDKYGAAYRDYLHRTPRWMGLPGRTSHAPTA
jgi:protein-S-isoprenylcysteine O-methyltransferase Ste14